MKDSHVKRIILLLLVLAVADVWGENKTGRAVSVEYQYTAGGQAITEADARSNEQIHRMSVGYIPSDLFSFSVGMGLERFKVPGAPFEGRFGISPCAAVSFYSPPFTGETGRLHTGLSWIYLNSEDSGILYEGPVYDPYAGLEFGIGRHFSFEIGIKGHILDGKIKRSETNEEVSPFSNRNKGRAYVSSLLKSPGEGIFAVIDFEFSPEFSKNWDRHGPIESAMGIKLGVLIREDKTNEKIEKKSAAYFPEMKKMKEKANELEEKK